MDDENKAWTYLWKWILWNYLLIKKPFANLSEQINKLNGNVLFYQRHSMEKTRLGRNAYGILGIFWHIGNSMKQGSRV